MLHSNQYSDFKISKLLLRSISILAVCFVFLLESCSTSRQQRISEPSEWSVARTSSSLSCSWLPDLEGVLYVQDVWQTSTGSLLVLGVTHAGKSKLFLASDLNGSSKKLTKRDSYKFLPMTGSNALSKKVVGYLPKTGELAYLSMEDQIPSIVLADLLSGSIRRRTKLESDLRVKAVQSSSGRVWVWAQKDLESGIENHLFALQGSALKKGIKIPTEDFVIIARGGVDHLLYLKDDGIRLKALSSSAAESTVYASATDVEIEAWAYGVGVNAGRLAVLEYDEEKGEKSLHTFVFSPGSLKKIQSHDLSDIEVESMGFYSGVASDAGGVRLISSQRLDTSSVIRSLDLTSGKMVSGGEFKKPQVLLKSIKLGFKEMVLIKEKGKYFWKFKICSLPG